MGDAYFLQIPDHISAPVVFASPHSGRIYPDDLKTRTNLSPELLRSSEDAFVDQLYGQAPNLGAPLLCATMARAYVDLNRCCEDLDPAVIEGVVARGHNPRIASGLGVIPRVVSRGRSIYSGKLSQEEAALRLQRYWRPYHKALATLLAQQRERFGMAVLIDCHSMPHEAVEHLSGLCPEVVIGDRFGLSASESIVSVVEDAYLRAGFRVMRNRPFSGAYIAQAYGRPTAGVHVVQVELDRSLYMDERLVQPRADFNQIADRLASVQCEIIGAFSQELNQAAQ